MGEISSGEFFLNGKVIGKSNPDEVNVITWRDVPLQEGDNEIIVSSGKHMFKCVKTYHSEPD